MDPCDAVWDSGTNSLMFEMRFPHRKEGVHPCGLVHPGRAVRPLLARGLALHGE